MMSRTGYENYNKDRAKKDAQYESLNRKLDYIKNALTTKFVTFDGTVDGVMETITVKKDAIIMLISDKNQIKLIDGSTVTLKSNEQYQELYHTLLG